MIKVEKVGNTANILFNNTKKRNALTLKAWEDISDAIMVLNRDEDLRCIVFKGSGDEAFASGADISEFPYIRKDSKQGIAYGKKTAKALKSILESLHPTVAIIQGACTGGGLEIAACCDIRIAATSARFGIPINRIGHAFAPDEMEPLLKLVGRGTVLEMLLEGRMYSAEEALQKGLVSSVFPSETLIKEAEEIVLRISRGAPQSVRVTKWVANLLCSGEQITNEHINRVYAPCDSDDYEEGIRAFLAKEHPNFTGK